MPDFTIETPHHTLDILEKETTKAQPRDRSGTAFVNIDVRVLKWLIADSRTLHSLHPDERSLSDLDQDLEEFP